jgi:spore cortex formation protein SpoVR/YcgB (stage V sporulation)
MQKPLVTSGQEWTFDLIEKVYEHIERIAKEKYNFDFYTNQIEIISSEQMLDAYSSNGLPIFYSHWSFGEQFVKQLESYQRGKMNLSYEIVINSNPCISYLMEENTMLMQTLVMCHAAIGHNTLFKNNYLFREWTNADTIIDYLAYAKKYIRYCEEEYGYKEVEIILDSAHAIQMHGVDKYKRPVTPTAAEEEKLRDERDAYIQSQVNEIWTTLPKKFEDGSVPEERFPKEKQENLLRFIEENAPRMEDWQREILRIVRNVSQYFYPQMQTKVLNEGFASFVHYNLMNDLYEEGIVSDDAMLEFHTSHANVLYQPDYDSPHYNGINPYALGFAIFNDVKRIALEPTEEDREWFGNQEWVGSGNWISEIKHISEEFKDESFIRQYLSPKVMRDFKLFDVLDDERDEQALEVKAIHDDIGYKELRNAIAGTYDIGYSIPDIQVVKVDLWGDRSMALNHFMINDRPLDEINTFETLRKIGILWGYNVSLNSINSKGEIMADYICNVKDDENILTIKTS